MADEESELDRLDPQPTEVRLESGLSVEVVRLKTRQLFRLMRILTKGAGPMLSTLNFGQEAEGFGAQLLGILMVAIPEAEAETIVFLQSMCKPVGIIDKPAAQMTKTEGKHNDELFERFNKDMFNPELEDTISIFEVIVENEAPDLQALGKKLSHLWTVARKAISTPEEKPPEAEELHLQDRMPDSSTGSATSTDGATSTSSTSRSAGSARRPKPRSTASA